MKLITIIILLLSVSAHANFKLNITPTDSKYAKMQIECADQANCDKKLNKWIKRSKFFTGEWNDVEAESIASKIEIDMEDVETTKYFHPSNFSVNLVDMSAELVEAALDKAISDKLNCGQKAVAFIAKTNVKKGLSKGQIKSMVKTYSDIFDLLKAGAIDTALDDVQNSNADGTILTNEDKTSIINFLTNC